MLAPLVFFILAAVFASISIGLVWLNFTNRKERIRSKVSLKPEQIQAMMSGKAITEKLFVRAGVHIEVILMADD